MRMLISTEILLLDESTGYILLNHKQNDDIITEL
jgi:hypothetical protein